jgi:hypothetical protein
MNGPLTWTGPLERCEGKRPLGIRRRRLGANITMDLQWNTIWDVDWIYLAQENGKLGVL